MVSTTSGPIDETVVIAEERWTRTELEVAKALYRAATNDPDYDFRVDPRGWSKLLFLRQARTAIREYEKLRNAFR